MKIIGHKYYIRQIDKPSGIKEFDDIIVKVDIYVVSFGKIFD